jgi:hypothetical protein
VAALLGDKGELPGALGGQDPAVYPLPSPERPPTGR